MWTFFCIAAYAATVYSAPNFVIILVDDWGWGDMGANGYGAQTPNLDKLSSEGMRFYDMHANSVCTPSRAALQTGRYNLRAGIDGNFDIDSKGGLSLNEITLGQFLSTSPLNYATMAVGKWHLGHSNNESVGYHPTWRGYDSYVGIPYSIDMGCTDSALSANGTEKRGCPTSGPANKTQLAIPLYNTSTPRCAGRGPTCSDFLVEQPVDLTELDIHYGDTAEAFFSKFGPGGDSKGRPFFAYFPFSHMHVPLSHNPRFRNSSLRNNLFSDTLLEMDATVGRIVDSLKSNGLADNTLLLVVGDNGPWNAYCEDAGSQGPFVGGYMQPAGTGTGKFTTWEGGHREASLAWFPGKIAPGQVSNVTLHIVDFFVTLASLANLPLPADRSYDGVDMSPILFQGATTTPRKFLFHQSGGNFTAARFGKYKGHYVTWSADGCKVPGKPRVEHNPPLIFDLDADPGETTPLKTGDMPPGLEASFVSALQDILKDIKSAPDTHTSPYHSGGFPYEACCNPNHTSCKCLQ